MARLTAKQRKSLPASKFAGPGRSYPIPDANHAKEAKIQASRAVHQGRMSGAEEKRIDVAADRVLHKSKPGNHKRSP